MDPSSARPFHSDLALFQAEGSATYDCPPKAHAFDVLPKRIRHEKKPASVPAIHLHLPAQLNVGSSTAGPSTTRATRRQVIEIVGSDSEGEVVEASVAEPKVEVGASVVKPKVEVEASVTKLKAEVDGSDWKF